jgi:hypothetical protein
VVPRYGGLVIATMLLLTAAGALLAADTPWTAAGVKDGITLSYRDHTGSGAREVRALADLPFPAAQIFALVCDQTQYGSLVAGLEEVRLLSGTVPGDYELYFRYAPRFAVVAARDVAVRVQSRTGDAGLGCDWSHLPDRVPPQPGAVRMRVLRGSWILDALDAARTRVVYQVLADPGGRLPGWLVRRGAMGAIPDVIQRVERRLRQPER